MLFDRYAVLDVETTNGDPRVGEVMEVAVIMLDGMTERNRWNSFVRPSGRIPPFIRRLTGISDGMVASAPRFHEVVRSLETHTRDRIVVAHNVRFDMTALEHEFARTGLVFERDTVCTERLSRSLLPGLDHYNLGSLCRHLGIPFTSAHRAVADAEATARLFQRLVEEFGMVPVHRQMTSWSRALHVQ